MECTSIGKDDKIKYTYHHLINNKQLVSNLIFIILSYVRDKFLI